MKIKLQGGSEVDFDTTATEETMRHNCPLFFRTPHGKRETYTVYNGSLIVRNTVQFTGCRPQRMTAVYLCLSNLAGHPDLFCVSAGSNISSIAQAKRLVDRIIAAREYHYGI